MQSVLENQDLLEFADGLGAFGLLFGSSSSLRLVMKDLQHRYVKVNQVWLDTFRYHSADQVIGKTAHDLFPQWRAERYIQEEKRVMETGIVLDYEEYLLNFAGEAERWRTLKGPWLEGGNIVGYVNLGIRLGQSGESEKRGDVMPKIVQVLAARACDDVSLEEIAKDLGVSKRTLERKFSKTMDETPAHFRMRCRVASSKRMLEKGATLAEIAGQCGFSDQSHFSKTFLKFEGLSPRRYLKRVQG